MNYNNKIREKNKYKKQIIIIVILFCIVLIVKIIPVIVLRNIINNDENINIELAKYKNIKTQEFTIVTLLDYLKVANQIENVEISFDSSENVVTNEKYNFNINISDMNQTEMYEIEYGVGDNAKKESFENGKYEWELKEGKNDFFVKIYKNNEIIGSYENTIFYIQPYEKQFLDELSNKSVQVHYIDGTWEKYEKSMQMISYCGFKNIKSSFLWDSIEKDNKFNFEYYDLWMNKASELGLKVYACINRTGKHGGDNKKIDNDEEVQKFCDFVKILSDRYPNIIGYDFLNEPNLKSNANGGYLTEQDVYWYSKTAKKAIQENPNINFVSAALSNYSSTTDSRLAMNDFFKYLYKNGVSAISTEFSYHVYDYTNQAKQDVILSKTLKEEQDLFNSFGGFIKTNITEYGLSSNNNNKVTEDIQAKKLVQQTTTMDEFNINFANLYNFWNTGDDLNEHEYNFGIVNHDYTPKLSYYSLKNFLTNTNGAEYIGTVNIADGLEAHVYDKDGKPKIIAWSDNSNKTIEIEYKNFTAKDLYGNDIENTDGTLSITSSPVYLDNISTNYFYQAIENTILEKYAEFEEKFGAEIANVEVLQEKIDFLKQYVSSLSDLEEESETVAKTKMEEHFDLGNMILTAYKNKELDVEYVKLSSMLDMLNDIGNSYEDLVTVSAVTKNPDLQGIKAVIDETEQVINNNSDLEIVYPTKILEFSKDLYEKAEYINNLEEENDIKTGLIVSYALHADYLADWANTFTNLYIDEYIENNPITENYSETELTNKDVTVTLNIGEDTKITNNDGKNTYTFKENGTFTFEYERRGRKDSKKIEVNYIDKILPEISGVENGTTYFEPIIPEVNDEHLKSVQLTLNGQVVKNYGVGNTISQNGIYELIATDGAGNTSQVEFYILEDENGYQIQNGNIVNINLNTTLEMFKENFTVIGDYTIKHNDNELNNDDHVSTGDILEWGNGKKFTIAVKADINGDGKLSLADISISRKYLLQIQDINEIQRLATDINLDEKNSLSDISLMRKMILGINIET